MAKVTSKLQVTIPKVIAREHGIEPGMELEFESAGETIRVRPVRRRRRAKQVDDSRAALAAFDAASDRQAARDARWRERFGAEDEPAERGWRREELYERGVPR